jgi:hypothetical protein
MDQESEKHSTGTFTETSIYAPDSNGAVVRRRNKVGLQCFTVLHDKFTLSLMEECVLSVRSNDYSCRLRHRF